MRTLTKMIVIAAIAAATAMERAQAQGELEYAETCFAIAWFENKTGKHPNSDPPYTAPPPHTFKILHWNPSVSGTLLRLPLDNAKNTNLFDKDKKFVGTVHYGKVTVEKEEIGTEKEDSVVFYLQANTRLKTFYPERALKVEIFHNRRIAVITHEDTSFRRMVPVQRYELVDDRNLNTYEKEPRTAINFGPLK